MNEHKPEHDAQSPAESEVQVSSESLNEQPSCLRGYSRQEFIRLVLTKSRKAGCIGAALAVTNVFLLPQSALAAPSSVSADGGDGQDGGADGS